MERIAAGKVVLSYLAKSENNIAFVSTHDVELAELLNDYYDYTILQKSLKMMNSV